MHKGIASRTLSYEDEDRILTAGGTEYDFDADGFLETKTVNPGGADEEVTSYSYSSRGEMLRADLPDGRFIEYVHDPLGRRIAKKVNGIPTEKYLWQGLTRLLAVYDGNDNLLMRFEYADGRMPVAMTAGGATYYLAYDQVGTLKAVSDSSGNVLLKREYDSFGNILHEEGTPPFEIPFGFAGGLHDKDTGLVRFGHRDYDPEIGRWTAKDPIGFGGGDTDLYGYCLSDSVNLIDPEGMSHWLIRLTEKSYKIVREISKKKAVKARRDGQNVLSKNKQSAHEIEVAARNGNTKDILRHKGHELRDADRNILRGNDGSPLKGRPHYQTDGINGHSFWTGIIGIIGSLLDPFDAIAGELARDEDYLNPHYENNCR
ncbi:RHS repeat domain-containing protein [Desulfonema magnum]|uniref:RHS repeat-associated core domain-containing protein n=1 Tax=Desulfonema magnum TaxID=45655 RepID=A0A975BEV1_9BACT|nr:RHS repeat-associated core domain-containing protein [Desulfonema magnum]QTA84136.1 RHS repeat-associated core domain-containing protein [Desulfonema magnum]